jgi:transposase
MTRKTKATFTPEQKLEHAKLMVQEGYSNKQVQEISGASESAISRWKKQYKEELTGHTPDNKTAITPEQQRIQELEKKLWRAHRDNDILKKAAAFSIRDNHSLN